MCLNPLLTIKRDGKIVSLKKLMEERKRVGAKTMQSLFESVSSDRIVELKCGKCQECIKSFYMEWKKRIFKELTFHKTNYIVNLTYDNENVKALNKADLQLFFKKMRKKYFVRYFYVGELGELNERPHYHIIMFGLQTPADLVVSKRKTKRNNIQYESKDIEKIWSKGLVTLNVADKVEIPYLFKYLIKNKGTKDFIYQMSKKIPIGVNPNSLVFDIYNRNVTKAEKNFYKKIYGELPDSVVAVQNKNIQHKIFEIQKQTKMKYYDYIQQKRQSYKNLLTNKNN